MRLTMSWNRRFIGIPINFWPFHGPLWKYVLPSFQMNVWVRLWREICRELNRNSKTYEKQNRENTRQTKNNHTHKIVFTWFSNLPTSRGVQGPASPDPPARNRPDRRSTGGSESTYGRSRIGKKTTRIFRFGSGFQNISPGKPEPTELVIIKK